MYDNDDQPVEERATPPPILLAASTCGKCGYSLVNLPHADVCPECGTSVNSYPEFARLRSLHKAAQIILIGLSATAVGLFGSAACGASVLGSIGNSFNFQGNDSTLVAFIVSLLLTFASLISVFVGFWCLAGPPLPACSSSRRDMRALLRGLVIATAIGLVFSMPSVCFVGQLGCVLTLLSPLLLPVLLFVAMHVTGQHVAAYGDAPSRDLRGLIQWFRWVGPVLLLISAFIVGVVFVALTESKNKDEAWLLVGTSFIAIAATAFHTSRVFWLLRRVTKIRLASVSRGECNNL
ncbi:MAG TPA: hypothetical protein VK157_12895 [Phycisphaerales bacterium]|nr:hypothetical protein [Phycisphaerales bacterium]